MIRNSSTQSAQADGRATARGTRVERLIGYALCSLGSPLRDDCEPDQHAIPHPESASQSRERRETDIRLLQRELSARHDLVGANVVVDRYRHGMLVPIDPHQRYGDDVIALPA